MKVQRPGVADLVDRDAAVMRLVARQAEHRIPAARRVGASGARRRAHPRHRVRARLPRRGERGPPLREEPRRLRHPRPRRLPHAVREHGARHGGGARPHHRRRRRRRRVRRPARGARPPPPALVPAPDPERRAVPRRPAPRERVHQPERRPVAHRLRRGRHDHAGAARRAPGHRDRHGDPERVARRARRPSPRGRRRHHRPPLARGRPRRRPHRDGIGLQPEAHQPGARRHGPARPRRCRARSRCSAGRC